VQAGVFLWTSDSSGRNYQSPENRQRRSGEWLGRLPRIVCELISDCDFLTIGATFTALRSYHFAVTCPWLVEGIAEPLRYVRFECGLNRWQRRSVALQQPGIEYDRCAFDSTNSPCPRVKPLAKLVVATGFTPGWIAGWKCGRRGGRPSRAMCVATGFMPGIRRDGAKIAGLEMRTTRRSSLPRYVRSDWLYARNPQGRCDDRGAGNADDAEVVPPALCT